MESQIAVNSAPNAPSTNGGNELNVGEKVYVSTRQAFGTLRYLGQIPKKSGTWAGVELLKAGTGKNDGSIEG
jgi:dynactin complex subunit